ncbi:cytochrome-c peroxidase [Hydrogenimonas sp.]
MKRLAVSGMAAMMLFFGGCGDENLDEEISVLTQRYGLTGDPAEGRDIPSVTDPKAELGMKLFYSKHLGLDMDVACVSCHHPYLGGGDALSLPIGVEAVDPEVVGPGRLHKDTGKSYYDGGPTVPRNTPSTFNAALFDRTQFWDARIESITPVKGANGSVGSLLVPGSSDYDRILWANGEVSNLPAAQANFPVTSPQEMRGFDHPSLTTKDAVRDYLVERLRGANGNSDLNASALSAWLQAFREGFSDPTADAAMLITRKNITDAIAEYERSQLFVDNPWNRYLNGEKGAISDEAKRGAILFFSSYEEGGANCVQCHKGDFFTDEQLHVMAVPQIGRGKNHDGTTEDYGRENVSLDEEDRYRFRTPTLLNVEVTGPWGHDGAFVTLEAMVKHMLKPETAADYDPNTLFQDGILVQCEDTKSNTQHALEQLERNRASGVSPHRSVDFGDEEVRQIVAFLKTLTDPCVKERSCLQKWVPDYDTNESKLLDLLEAKL